MTTPTTLSSRFRILIPKAIRDEKHWEAGQAFAFNPKGRGVLLIPVPKLSEIAGIAEGANTGQYRDRRERSRREG